MFNETLTFHIPIGILHQTSFMLAVKSQTPKRTEDELLGKIFLGPSSTGSEFDHWNEMRINNKPIARWHKLLDWQLQCVRWVSVLQKLTVHIITLLLTVTMPTFENNSVCIYNSFYTNLNLLIVVFFFFERHYTKDLFQQSIETCFRNKRCLL